MEASVVTLMATCHIASTGLCSNKGANLFNFVYIVTNSGLVVIVSGYRDRVLGFDSRRYQIFCVVVGLVRGPLSIVRSIEELLE